MEEQKLIQEILTLYEELKAEENGSYLPGSGFKIKEPPSSLRYAEKAKQLFASAIELAKINSEKYCTSLLRLQHTMEKEVDYVGKYSYEYQKGKSKPTTKSLRKLVGLMQDATGHVYRDFVGLLMPPD